MISRIVADEKLLGFQTAEEGAYLAFNLIVAAADTVGTPTPVT